MRSLPTVSNGKAPAFRTSVEMFSNNSMSRTPPLTKTISPSLTPATCATSRFERASRSVADAFLVSVIGAGLVLFSATLVGGCAGWHESSTKVEKTERNIRQNFRDICGSLGMFKILGLHAASTPDAAKSQHFGFFR